MSPIYKVLAGLANPVSAAIAENAVKLQKHFRSALSEVPVEHLAAISRASILNSIIINQQDTP